MSGKDIKFGATVEIEDDDDGKKQNIKLLENMNQI